MKRRGILAGVALTAIALFAVAAPVAALSPHSPVFTDANQPVVVRAGDEFFIALPSNPSTGYSWSQAIDDGQILAYEGSVYEAASNGLPGGQGQQIFIYHANRSGATSVHLTYGRPFEAGSPSARTATFSVTVQ